MHPYYEDLINNAKHSKEHGSNKLLLVIERICFDDWMSQSSIDSIKECFLQK